MASKIEILKKKIKRKKVSGKVKFDFKNLTRKQKDEILEAMKNPNWRNN